jgi:hypothetical protein
MGSARTVTGVGPRNVFMITGTASATPIVDNLLGGVTAGRSGVGVYQIDHNIGNTAYCCQFTGEDVADADVFCYAVDRGIDGVTCQCVSNGIAYEVDFIHGTIHDGGG